MNRVSFSMFTKAEWKRPFSKKISALKREIILNFYEGNVGMHFAIGDHVQHLIIAIMMRTITVITVGESGIFA